MPNLSANQMQESQSKFPENQEGVLSDTLKKTPETSNWLITWNFSVRGRDMTLFKEDTYSKIFYSLNHAPFTPYIPSSISNEHKYHKQLIFLPSSDQFN